MSLVDVSRSCLSITWKYSLRELGVGPANNQVKGLVGKSFHWNVNETCHWIAGGVDAGLVKLLLLGDAQTAL